MIARCALYRRTGETYDNTDLNNQNCRRERVKICTIMSHECDAASGFSLQNIITTPPAQAEW
jgi:hypothetical protein